VLDSIDTAAHLPGDLRIPPGGLLMGEQENPRAIQFSSSIPISCSANAGWAANRRQAAAMFV
jgi:hypothetical protein